MIKSLKKIATVILKIIIVVAVFLAITIVIIFKIDDNRVSYLKISEENYTVNSYVLKNVNLIPMNKDTVLFNKSVLIEEGIITRIDSSIQSTNYTIIDGLNKYLTPGLIDMHVHVWDKHELGLYLANGVTTVRNMWGIPAHLRMKKQIVENKLLGPIFFTSTPKLTGPEDGGPDKIQINSPEEAKKLIKQYKLDGYDVVKTYVGLPKNIYDAIITQSKIEGLTIATHPSYKVDYKYHFQPEFETIEHTEEIVQSALKFKTDSIKLQSIIELYKTHQKSHTPTLSIFQNIIDILEQEQTILDSEETSYVNPGFIKIGSKKDLNRWINDKVQNPSVVERIKQQHQQHLKIVKMLDDYGVNIVCGSDAGIMFAPPGLSTHEELGYYVKAGLSNYKALATATVNASKVDSKYKNLGTLEVGKTANLILTESNPLEDISVLKHPKTVWIKGRMIDQQSIQLFKKKAKNRKTGAASILRFIESFIQ